MGQVQYPNGLSHIEKEDLASFPHCPRLKDKLGGLRKQHEVPRCLRVGHPHRSPSGDLPLKEREDTPIASQHVPEPDGNKRGWTAVEREQ